MKFLIDAQLPPSLAELLKKEGYDAVHTLMLPNKNKTSDKAINDISVQEKRIVITKDLDFFHSALISNKPYKLLLIRTGNMKSKALKKLIITNIRIIALSFKNNRLVELSSTVKVLY